MISNITTDTADIRWQPPEYSGGLPISNYIVELKESTRTAWRRVATLDATTTSYTLTNLREGKEYVVRVIAKNREGESFPLLSDFILMQQIKGVTQT